MNIFVLDEDPTLAAIYQCDKHISKMIVETAQMLSTNIRLTNGNTSISKEFERHLKDPNRKEIYKVSYQNHPCTIWARKTKGNFLWLKKHGLALCDEYNYRYEKIHGSYPIIASCRSDTIPVGELTKFELCMPDIYKQENAVEAYRNLYAFDKSRFAKWNKVRPPPEWYSDKIKSILLKS